MGQQRASVEDYGALAPPPPPPRTSISISISRAAPARPRVRPMPPPPPPRAPSKSLSKGRRRAGGRGGHRRRRASRWQPLCQPPLQPPVPVVGARAAHRTAAAGRRDLSASPSPHPRPAFPPQPPAARCAPPAAPLVGRARTWSLCRGACRTYGSAATAAAARLFRSESNASVHEGGAGAGALPRWPSPRSRLISGRGMVRGNSLGAAPPLPRRTGVCGGFAGDDAG